MTQLKMRVKNLAASRLGESSDKALGTKHAYQVMLKWNLSLINLRETPERLSPELSNTRT